MPDDLTSIHSIHLNQIRQIFDQKISDWQYHGNGFDCFAYEVNGEWIFKIPRRAPVWEMLKREKAFLKVFSEISPIPVPKIEFWGAQILGYRKIKGIALRPEKLHALSNKQKDRVAQDLGHFLSELHQCNYPIEYVSNYRNIFTYAAFEHFMPKVERIILPQLSGAIRQNVRAFLKRLQSNSVHFEHSISPVHADLYGAHIYWSDALGRLSGIIDFGEISKNATIMDFTIITDFCDPTHDRFLKQILLDYHSADPTLFQKIKLFSKLEKLYWPIEDLEDSEIMPEKLHDLSKSLQKIEDQFAAG